ncbi:hypothetical protein ABW21_db0200009 [Orbilia brochopaga]|nr:hypothetical protein ABW21_db0200009 [Drechslerella brochopaga]
MSRGKSSRGGSSSTWTGKMERRKVVIDNDNGNGIDKLRLEGDQRTIVTAESSSSGGRHVYGRRSGSRARAKSGLIVCRVGAVKQSSPSRECEAVECERDAIGRCFGD